MTAAQTTQVDSRPAAEAYVGGVCFKQGPPRLVGAELEWLTSHVPGGERPSAATLARALGRHAPTSIDPDSPAAPLSRGSLVTVEPGGQIELSSAPRTSARELCDCLDDDRRTLETLLAPYSIEISSAATDVARPPSRILRLPRYCAMESRFAGIGPYGTLMMCNTAAVQIDRCRCDALHCCVGLRRRVQLHKPVSDSDGGECSGGLPCVGSRRDPSADCREGQGCRGDYAPSPTLVQMSR